MWDLSLFLPFFKIDPPTVLKTSLFLLFGKLKRAKILKLKIRLKPTNLIKVRGTEVDYQTSIELEREPVQGCERGKEWFAIENLVLVGNQRRR